MILGPPYCPTGCGERVDPRHAGFLCATCWGLLSRGDHRRMFEAWKDLQDGLHGASGHIAAVKADLVQKAKAARGEPIAS